MMMNDFNFHSGMMYVQTVDQSFIRNVLLDCNISEFLYYKIEFECYSPLVYTVLWLNVWLPIKRKAQDNQSMYTKILWRVLFTSDTCHLAVKTGLNCSRISDSIKKIYVS